MTQRYRFNRLEFSGSLGDLGTLLPLALGLVLVNGLDPLGVFFTIGLFFIFSGVFFGVTVPVQPMKVIGAYAIATAMPASQILAAGALMGVFMLVIGATGAITPIGRFIPHSVVRGVQLSTGVLLMAQGIRMMIGTSSFQLLQQAAEPYLTVQAVGPLPVGVVIGTIGMLLTLLLLENKHLPAGLFVVLGGMAIGLTSGTGQGLETISLGFHLPGWLPLGWPAATDFASALVILVLPQIPMTLGNAVVAYVDLSADYFPEAAGRVTYRRVCISMALASFASFVLGGIPLCHGAGGLAAHYRFGARTAGSNLIAGTLFLLLSISLGSGILAILFLIPMAVLGVLLIFAGSQLAMTVIDLKTRKDLFVAVTMVGITLAANLAAGFAVGIAAAYLLKSKRLTV
jgi:SulP family sulfate permease